MVVSLLKHSEKLRGRCVRDKGDVGGASAPSITVMEWT